MKSSPKSQTVSKSLFLLLAVFQFAFSQDPTIWDGDATDTTWFTDNQNATHFTISRAAQLAGLAKLLTPTASLRTDPYTGEEYYELSNGYYSMVGKTIILANNINLDDKDWVVIGGPTTKLKYKRYKPIYSEENPNGPPIRWEEEIVIIDVGPFKGTFDGNVRTISGVKINSPSKDYQGVFGYINEGATIKNLKVEISNDGIKGKDNVGGLVGYVSDGTIDNCRISGSGTVDGFSIVGGLVGNNIGNGKVINSYADVNVEGYNVIGGLVGNNVGSSKISNNRADGNVTGRTINDAAIGGLLGYNYSADTVSNSLATGKVKLSPTNTIGEYTGGLIGQNDVTSQTRSTIINSYYDKIVSEQNDIDKGDGKTTAEMEDTTLVHMLNYVAYENSWNAWDTTTLAPKYPKLTQYPASNMSGFFASGDGTRANPYIINTAPQLKYFAALVNAGISFEDKYLKLSDSLDLASIPNWIPIGKYYSSTNNRPFSGTFDGNGYVIKNVNVNITGNAIDRDKDNGGLFGYVDSVGIIKNLGVVGGTIIGRSSVGGLVARNSGKIINCYAKVDVTGTRPDNTYVYAGGLVGYNDEMGIINNSFSVGTVMPSPSSPNTDRGGLVGNNAGTVTNSYYSQTSGQSDTGKGESKTTNEMKDDDFYYKLNYDAYKLSMNKWKPGSDYPSLIPDTLATNLAFTGGTGTQNDPYIIETEENLRFFSLLVNGGDDFSGETIMLDNQNQPIDLINIANWTPIGSLSTPFNGTFDGDGYVIKNVNINRPNEDNQSLFGYVDSDGIIKNLGVVGGAIKGRSSVGGLVARNSGTIINCYAIVDVEGTRNNTYIYVGGLVGYNTGIINNNFAVGSVTVPNYNNNNTDRGGLVGYNGGTVTNSYYDKTASYPIADTSKGDGKITAEMRSNRGLVYKLRFIADSLSANGWNYVVGEYPTLSNDRATPIQIPFTGGGTENSPYIISTVSQLEEFSELVNAGITFEDKYLKLSNEIPISSPANWTPIGSPSNPFKGTFNGGGYAISGVNINRPDADNQGLFGYVDSSGTIKNLGVVGDTIIGKSTVGSLVANNNGSIINCYAVVDSVTGIAYAGGLAGSNSGIIRNSFSVGKIKAGSISGGLVGYNTGNVTGSYYDKDISNKSDTGKGEGKTTYEMLIIDFVHKLNYSAYNDSLSLNGWQQGSTYPSLTPNPAANLSFASGTGAENDPYIITKEEHLRYFSLLVNVGDDFSDKTIMLGDSIALIANWTPIGNSSSPFNGTFDGAGYVISDVNINRPDADNQGLFGYIGSSGTIKNLGVRGSVIGASSVGGLAASNSGTIINCYAIVNVTGNTNTGGLAGSNNGTIRNSFSAGIVTAAAINSNGGLVGYKTNTGIVTNSYYAAASGQSDIGKGEKTDEMKSRGFVYKLKFIADSLSENDWVDNSPTGYPTLSNQKAVPIQIAFGSGDGTQNNPYIINTKLQLEEFSAFVNAGTTFEGEYFKLGANIPITGIANWSPIGNSSNPFKGTFNGDGYVISGVNINRSGADNQGLFGYVDTSAVIKNLGVAGSIIGRNSVGGLVANNSGSIINCYAVVDSVTGTANAGGLAGSNSGIIKNSFSVGKVKATSGGGGLVGNNTGTVANSYYDLVSGQSDTGKGEGKTTTEMKSKGFAYGLRSVAASLFMNGWSDSTGKYPVLKKDTIATAMNINDYLSSGTGANANTYYINTVYDLEVFSALVNNVSNFSGKTIMLGKNLALNDTTGWQNWQTTPPAYAWTPIGNSSNPFRGTFDGNGFVISGVYINSAGDYQGLFGSNYGTIKNLGVVKSNIKGNRYVGALAGYSNDAINSSYADLAVVSGSSDVGGLVGRNYFGTIRNSFANVATTATTDYAGGLVGWNNGTISNSYAIGKVTGTGSNVGGLAGYNDVVGTISNSYYNKETSTRTDAGKGDAKTTAEMKLQTTYSGWNFERNWAIDPIINGGYPYLLLESQEVPIHRPQIASGQISVHVMDGRILLGNLPANAKVELYNLHGKRVYSAISAESQLVVPLPARGMYIVRIGAKTFKVTM